MILKLPSLIALAAGALVALAPASAGAEQAKAATPPVVYKDGPWVIAARCYSFLCPVKQKQLIAHVHGGRVERLEGLPGTATGQVGPGGMVTITVNAFGVVGHVQPRRSWWRRRGLVVEQPHLRARRLVRFSAGGVRNKMSC